MERGHRKFNGILILLFVGVLMGALDISVVGPAIPAIEKSIDFGTLNLSLIFTVYVLFYLIGLPVLSKLSDIYGRKMMYMASVAIFGIGSLVVSSSQNIEVLLAGRAIQGFGASGIFPVAAATIGDIFPAGKRGKALGMLGAIYGIAFIVGPVLAGTFLEFLNWNALFLLNLPVAAILIFFAFKLLPGKPESSRPSFDWTGIIYLIIVLGSFTIGANNIETTHIRSSLFSWTVFPFMLLFLFFLPILLNHARKKNDSFINIRFFQTKQLRLVSFLSFGLGFYQSCIVFIPKISVELYHVTPAKASFMLLPLVLSTAIFPPIGGRFLDSIGSRVIIIIGLVFAVGSLFVLSLLTSNIPVFYAALAGLGIGLSIRPPLKFIILNEIDHRNRATSLGMLMILISVGQIAGATLLGSVIAGPADKVERFGSAFLLLATISFVLLLVSFFLKNKDAEKNITFK